MRCRFCAISVPYPREFFLFRDGSVSGLLYPLILNLAEICYCLGYQGWIARAVWLLLVKRLSSSMCVLDLEYESEDFRYCQVLWPIRIHLLHGAPDRRVSKTRCGYEFQCRLLSQTVFSSEHSTDFGLLRFEQQTVWAVLVQTDFIRVPVPWQGQEYIVYLGRRCWLRQLIRRTESLKWGGM